MECVANAKLADATEQERSTMKINTNKTFNWLDALEAAVKQEPTNDQYEDLFERSNEWPLCAVGQLCKALPRTMNGSPKDEALYMLGQDFTRYIGNGSWSQALATFHTIEARTSLLLAQMKEGKGEGQ